MSREQIQIKHGTVREMIGGGWLDLRPGQWTDDTAMTLCLLEGILDRQGFDREETARRYLAWMQTKPVDIGNTVRSSLGLMAEGRGVEEASRLAHEELLGGESAGNGTVMRCAPLAALHRDDPPALVRAAWEDARITHWDPLAASGSAFLALTLAALLRGAGREEAVEEADGQLLENDLDLYNPLPDTAYVAEKDLKPTPYVVDTLTCAFWYFRQGENYEESLVRAVNRGGDSDTIGAVLGALLGAAGGLEAIPDRWARVVKDRGRLLARAKRLAALAGGRGD
jgi:ADP-ribosyl-[dinitrogen reductase] hydrolase